MEASTSPPAHVEWENLLDELLEGIDNLESEEHDRVQVDHLMTEIFMSRCPPCSRCKPDDELDP